jgi:hypothetical protein
MLNEALAGFVDDRQPMVGLRTYGTRQYRAKQESRSSPAHREPLGRDLDP